MVRLQGTRCEHSQEANAEGSRCPGHQGTAPAEPGRPRGGNGPRDGTPDSSPGELPIVGSTSVTQVPALLLTPK